MTAMPSPSGKDAFAKPPARVLALLPALATVAAFALLSGIPSCRDIRSREGRARQLGSVEEHEMESMALRRRIQDARADLEALRAGTGTATVSRAPSPALPAAAFGEAHLRILAHGARILHVSPGPRAGGRDGSSADGEAAHLLRQRSGREPRAWNVSIEASWSAVQALLDDFAAADGDAPLVQSLTMQPAVGDGKPACWLLTILQ